MPNGMMDDTARGSISAAVLRKQSPAQLTLDLITGAEKEKQPLPQHHWDIKTEKGHYYFASLGIAPVYDFY